MKTIYKSYYGKSGKECMEKFLELKSKYNFPITHYTTGQGLIIRPCIDKTIQPDNNHADTILKYLSGFYMIGNGISFTKISDDLNISIPEVLSNCLYLIKNNENIIGDIGRSSACVAIHYKR
jgi:phage-related holin